MALTTPTEQSRELQRPWCFLPQKLATYFGVRTYLLSKKNSATLLLARVPVFIYFLNCSVFLPYRLSKRDLLVPLWDMGDPT